MMEAGRDKSEEIIQKLETLPAAMGFRLKHQVDLSEKERVVQETVKKHGEMSSRFLMPNQYPVVLVKRDSSPDTA